jgi:hypothetical protein
MSNESENLIQAEKAIEELLLELEELKRQVEGYKTAKEALAAVQLQLQKMIEQTQELSEETLIGVRVLSKIGTPEILTRIESVSNGISQLSARFDQHFKNQETKNNEQAANLLSKLNILLGVASVSVLVGFLILFSKYF